MRNKPRHALLNINDRERVDLTVIPDRDRQIDQIAQQRFFWRQVDRWFVIALIVTIRQQFEHVVERSTALPCGDLNDLYQFAQRLRRRHAVVVKVQMNALWQHPARLHRVGTHHFQQNALDAHCVVVKCLG